MTLTHEEERTTGNREPDENSVARAMGRGFVIGTIAGFIVVSTIVTVMMLRGGATGISALGVGLFAAAWGGPGFGGMIGGLTAMHHAEESLEAHDSMH